ncbi:hypothetical protein JR316_0002692 [Psilocybe cubensis]|uniref:Uncharacterized protein n=2 Tax=Psilocybe cubensis TaxID=181762 RepID=A0ACB8HDJ1_PSICU|nr:hypothetical protein JR316_0002692 [Psilocybe cubensis]KAH9485777.1 hypothetical protein JR316_0002692 [Psilocybe cubensis]
MEKSKLQKAEGPTLISPRSLQTSSCSCKRLENGEFGRNLVVCVDGTANKFGMQNTNVVELYSRLVKDDTQLTYYNSGIGTHAGKAKPSFLTQAFEMAIGRNIENNVLDAYEWLSENYKAGDRIYLFGFSRGAYQVRIIAGMIEKVGLLHKGNKQQIPFAYDLYIKLKANQKRQEPAATTGTEGSGTNQVFHRMATSLSNSVPRAVATATRHKPTKTLRAIEDSETVCRSFKRTLSHTGVKVHFVGCWDTVSSVGVVRRESLPETTTGMAHVCVFRHALALDELRVKFLPEYVNGGEGPQHGHTSVEAPISKHENGTKPDVAAEPEHKPKTTRGNVKEVWFAGCHSDVGGGNIENLDANKFGPALRWMTYESITWGLRTTPFDQSWQPLYPQSSMTGLWKIAEYIPFKRLSYTGPNDVTRSLHKQAPRRIMPGQLIHESVRDSYTGSMNKPLACFRNGSGRSWDHWDGLHNIIENDPYIQPSTVLDRIQKTTAGHQITSDTREQLGLEADYDVLYTASLQDIGLRVIRERQDAETILASALVHEIGTFDRTSERIPKHISTIAKTLDRCFSLFPRKPIEVAADAQAVFEKLFENNPDACLKFLYHFANSERRQNIANAEIKRHMEALQRSAESSFSSGRIHSIKALALAFLNLLMATPSDDGTSYSYPGWMDGTYIKLISFHELSNEHRVNVLLELLSLFVAGMRDKQRGHLEIRLALLKEIDRYTYPIDDGPSMNIPEDAPRYLELLYDHAYELQTRFSNRGGNMDDLNQAISFYKHYDYLERHPEDFVLHNFACALSARFQNAGKQSDIEESIALHRRALELRPPPHPIHPFLLSNLAISLMTRFDYGGNQSDLDECIALHRQTLELRPSPHPDRSSTLTHLTNALLARFEEEGKWSDIEESIILSKQALEVGPMSHPDRPWLLNNLANAFSARFRNGGQQSDIEESIASLRQALALQPRFHPDRPVSLCNLANALSVRFEHGDKQSDLQESIALLRQALELQPPHHTDRPLLVSNLADSLSVRFENGGDESDIEESIALLRQALELQPLSRPNRSLLLSSLANSLSVRFDNGGDESDIEESIALVRQALELQPLSHPNRPPLLSRLANTLAARFENGGDESDIQESIALHRQALELQPPLHLDRPSSLNDLAYALFTRFENGGQKSDIDESISISRNVLELQSSSHPNRHYTVDALAYFLIHRFEQYNDQNDIQESVLLLTEALDLQIPNHSAWAGILTCLAHALQCRFERVGGEQADIDQSIILHEQAVELKSPNKSSRNQSFANALRIRFEHGGEPSDIDKSIRLFKEALESKPAPHRRRPGILDELAKAFEARYKKDGQQSDLDEAKALREEAQTLRDSYR